MPKKAVGKRPSMFQDGTLKSNLGGLSNIPEIYVPAPDSPRKSTQMTD